MTSRWRPLRAGTFRTRCHKPAHNAQKARGGGTAKRAAQGGRGAASPVCVVTPESRPRRALGDALAVEEAVVNPDDRCKGFLGRDRVAPEARIRRGEAATINALAFGVALVGVDRCAREIATGAAGQTGWDDIGD